MPKNYEEGMGPIIFQPYAEDLAKRVDVGSREVLEIAAGTGRLTAELCKRLSPDANLTVTDLNKDMLSVAQGLISDERISWHVADAQQLSFPDSKFDAMLCQYGVMFYKDKVAGQSEAFRVLRSGGAYLFNVWDSLEHNPWADLIQQSMVEMFPDDYPTFFNVPFGYFDEAQIRADLAAGGFDDVQIERVKKDVIAEDAGQLARGGVEGSPLAAALAERGITDLKPIVEQIRTRFEKNFGNSPMRSTMQALVITASKPA